MPGQAARWTENQIQAQPYIRVMLVLSYIFRVEPCFEPVLLDRGRVTQNSAAQTFESGKVVHTLSPGAVPPNRMRWRFWRGRRRQACGVICFIAVKGMAPMDLVHMIAS
jgi:hypothetical protein